MENKELKKILFKKPARLVLTVKEETARLEFGEEIVELSYSHPQGCCEKVWADFEIFNYYKNQLDNFYIGLKIKSVPEMGILVCLDWEYDCNEDKIFIPCYNEQNGYYSNDLILKVKHNGTED